MNLKRLAAGCEITMACVALSVLVCGSVVVGLDVWVHHLPRRVCNVTAPTCSRALATSCDGIVLRFPQPPQALLDSASTREWCVRNVGAQEVTLFVDGTSAYDGKQNVNSWQTTLVLAAAFVSALVIRWVFFTPDFLKSKTKRGGGGAAEPMEMRESLYGAFLN